MAPRCSVVIPVHNMARYLPEAVESVFAQRECPVDVVIVDDGSSDASAEVARGYASDRVKVVDEGALGGQSGARNRGLLECKGDAVVFLDADDKLLPGALGRFMGALAHDGRLAVAYGEVLVVDAEGRPLGTGTRPLFPRRRPSGDVVGALLRGTPIAAPGAACIRRRNLDKAGGFRNLRMAEDWELYFRLSLTGRFLYLRGEPVLAYRRHPESLTALHAERVESLMPAIDAVLGNPALEGRFPAWFLASQRRRCIAGAYGHAGRTALRKGNWSVARRNFLECLRRDPWRLREAVFLLAALARRLPAPLRRRIK